MGSHQFVFNFTVKEVTNVLHLFKVKPIMEAGSDVNYPKSGIIQVDQK